jgi:hypothetical protein
MDLKPRMTATRDRCRFERLAEIVVRQEALRRPQDNLRRLPKAEAT